MNDSPPPTDAQEPIAAVILAAGLGSRFRALEPSLETKLVARVGDEPIVRHVARTALASRATPIIVVTGHAEAAVRQALHGLNVGFIHNLDHASGLASSLKTGLAAVPFSARGALVLLGDMPNVPPSMLDRLIDLFEAHPNCAAVAPTHAGVRGNPALLSRRLFAQIKSLRGDEGARRLLEQAGDQVIEWETNDSIALDVDTPDELRKVEALQNRHARRGPF